MCIHTYTHMYVWAPGPSPTGARGPPGHSAEGGAVGGGCSGWG